MFLPATQKEIQARNWDQLDVILVTGDAYIDSPFMGIAVIGKVLMDAGFRVGIIAQPDLSRPDDIRRLGEPKLFWGVSGGAVDSMVANYTALKKRRKKDDYTPGGQNIRRPDRAVIAYTNLIRRFHKNTAPIVLGGIEASLRRVAHFDFWSNKIRRSILFDAKADFLLFGMAHQSVIQLARALKESKTPRDIRGLSYISKSPHGKELPSFEDVQNNPSNFIDSFNLFYENTDPLTAEHLCQKHQDRFLILNPPPISTTRELDKIHDLDYERDAHPMHKKDGEIRALETIRFSIPTHYGCYGECHFCAITVHQGRTVRFRSQQSILKEARSITRLKGFKGYITDLGGPTANMYGFECKKKLKKGACTDKRCLFPEPCPTLSPDHRAHLSLIREIEKLPGIKKVFISSGLRYDLMLADKRNGIRYLAKITADNVSGQMKIAPEHVVPGVLKHMGKQNTEQLLAFKEQFDRLSKKSGKKQFLTYYLIAAHPGCSEKEMKQLKKFTREKLKITPEQVQIFTPTPSTYSTLMYATGLDPFSKRPLFVEKDPKKKDRQKQMVTQKRPLSKRRNPKRKTTKKK